MATAWEILTGNSTLPDNGVNTAWLHLQNQQGGGGIGNIYLLGPATADISDDVLSASVDDILSTSNVTSDVLEANIIEECEEQP